MKTIILLFALSIVGVPKVNRIPDHCLMPMAMAQVPPPGNPGHQEPAPGETCRHDASDPAHNCTCHRECRPDTDEEGNPSTPPSQHVVEDPKCRVYCYKDSCRCPVSNCD